MPLEVGGQPDQPIAAAHEARHADPDADERRPGRRVLDDLTDEPGHGRTHLPGLAVVVDRRLRPLQHLAAETHPGDDRAIHAEIHGDDVGPLRRYPDLAGGPTGALPGTPDRRRAFQDAQ